MKHRKPADTLPEVRCELCGELESEPGQFATCEGFLVCVPCKDEKGPELTKMRHDVENERDCA